MAEQGTAILGGLLGALAGLATAAVKIRAETRRWEADRSRQVDQWRQDALVRAMGFLTGGRQERSVGIGIIDALIAGDNVPLIVRTAVDRVLWTQLIYVSNHGDLRQRHENLNARRLIALVEASPDKEKVTGYSKSELSSIRDRADAESAA